MSLLPSTALFQPANPNQAAAVLILIENSEKMLESWSELKDLYLDNLLNIFEQVHSNNPITVITLESSPLANQFPRQYSGAHEGLQNIHFNFDANNRLSTGKIKSAVNLLGSFKFKGQPVASHLIIIAASTPEQEALPGIRQYSWFLVREKLAQLNIYCHLALVQSGEDLSSLGGLFEKTLWLGGSVEVDPPFQPDASKFVFRFAGAKQQPPKQQEQLQHVADISSRTTPPIWTSQVQPDFKALQIIPSSTSPPPVQESIGERTYSDQARSSEHQPKACQSSTSYQADLHDQVPYHDEPNLHRALKQDWPSFSGGLAHKRSQSLPSIIGDRDEPKDIFYSNLGGAPTSISPNSFHFNMEEGRLPSLQSLDTYTPSGNDSVPVQEGSVLGDGDDWTNNEPFLLEAQAMVEAEANYKGTRYKRFHTL